VVAVPLLDAGVEEGVLDGGTETSPSGVGVATTREAFGPAEWPAVAEAAEPGGAEGGPALAGGSADEPYTKAASLKLSRLAGACIMAREEAW